MRNNRRIQKLSHTLSHTVLVLVCCMDVYMQSNAWQRSCVRSPAIKKAQGARGGRGGQQGGEGGGRGGVCFSSGARLQSRVDVEKPGNGKMVQRGCSVSEPSSQTCTQFY